MVRERIIRYLLLLVAFSALGSLALITLFIFKEGLPLIVKVGLWRFIFGSDWSPSHGSFGILSLIIGSLWVTAGALIFGVPLGVAVAIFTVEFAPPALASAVRPLVQLLAGIPSVIYGFVGLTVLIPQIQRYLGGPGPSALAGAMVLAIMILPTIVSISEDSIRAVPRAYRDGALALGATHWQTVWRMVLPAARSGILSSIILGMGRAIGETMAVIMVVGNALTIPFSPLQSVTTLTSNIGLEMAYATGDHRRALFATGVVLFVIIMALSMSASVMSRRSVRR